MSCGEMARFLQQRERGGEGGKKAEERRLKRGRDG